MHDINIDPGTWLDTIDRGVDALPYGEAILIAFAVVGVVRWGLVPLIRAIRGK